MSDRKLSLLANPAAGSGRSLKLLTHARRILDSGGVSYKITLTDSLQHAREEARIAATAGDLVVAVGGDGLLGTLAGEVSRANGVIGVIPAGRGNDFARVLNIPKDVEHACKVLMEGRVMTVDMGEVNGAPFLGIASTGFDSVANEYANSARLVRGRMAYAYGGLKALLAWKPASFKIRADGDSWEMTGYSVACANSKAYGGGMYVAPDADLEDGLFDVITVSQVSKLTFIRNVPKVFSGKHVGLNEVETRRAAEIEIEADRPFPVYADGEEIAHLPARVRILPGALRIIAP